MSEAQSYRVLIADDHPLFRGALREALNRQFDRVEVAEAGTFEQVVERVETGGEVDLILLDLQMPGARGFSGLMYLRAQYPSLPVAIVSANDDPVVIRHCMEFGAAQRLDAKRFWQKTCGADQAAGNAHPAAGARADDALGRAPQ